MSLGGDEVGLGIVAYLRGFGRNNRDGLVAVSTYRAWLELAAFETERRMLRILESLPLNEVKAIAQHEVDLNELAGQVLVDLDAE